MLQLACNKSGKWAYGTWVETRGSLVGCGGGGGLPGFGKYHTAFKSREEAAIAGLTSLLTVNRLEKKHPNGKSSAHITDKIKELIKSFSSQNPLVMSQSKKTSLPALSFKKQTGAEQKEVALAAIIPDPTQPRKEFDELIDAELLDSVKAQGILQPILLRPIICTAQPGLATGAHEFLIVCGERRFRAATAAGLSSIPAIIRPLNDEEALDAQIVENLQRKDVHEMEEALAFKRLAEKGLTQEEIGIRVGKNDRFIRARLVLCNLNERWQKLFLRRAFDLTTALKVCRYPHDVQEDIFKDLKISKTDLDSKDLRISVNNLSDYKGDLSTACFDLTDKTLNPIMGACIGCQFNSATTDLFPGDTKKPRCLNPLCFKEKVDAGFKQKLAGALDNEDIVLIKTASYTDDDKTVKTIKTKGLKVVESANYREVVDMDPGTFEDWKTKSLAGDWQGQDYDPVDSEAENIAVYNRQLKSYDDSMKKAQKGLKEGTYKHALVVQGTDDDPKGKIMIVELVTRNGGGSKSKSDETPAQKIAAGKATIPDYELEIKRVKEGIESTKKKQKDEAHLKIIETFKGIPGSMATTNRPMTAVERNLLIIYMIEEMGGFDHLQVFADDMEAGKPLDDDEQFAIALGIAAMPGKKSKNQTIWTKNKSMDFDDEKNREAIWDYISTLTDGHLGLIFRRLMLHKFGGVTTIPSSYKSGQAYLMRRIAEQWEGVGENEINIPLIEKEAKIKADKRMDNARVKIKQLEQDRDILLQKKDGKKIEKPKETKKPEIPKADPKPVMEVPREKMEKAREIFKGTPLGDITWPGASEAFETVGLMSYEDYAKLADVINSFPASPYSDYFRQGLIGNWNIEGTQKKMPHGDAALLIIGSAEFMALLRITNRSLNAVELKGIDYRSPADACATNPEKCREIVDKLVTFWRKLQGQLDRKAIKSSKKEEHKAVTEAEN